VEQNQALLKLSTKSLLEQLCLLFISVNMMSTVLSQVVELLAILIDTVGPLLQVQKLLLLVVHETRWNVLKSGSVSSPPSSYRASKLLGGMHSLFVLCVVK
jgi:hypothetical protein